MRLLVCSDLHLEFHRDRGRRLVCELAQAEPDVLVLAGDVSNAAGIVDALSMFAATFRQVVYVAGNHEFYGGSVEEVEGELEKFADHHSNFHWLNESTTTIDGQRFIGATLWFADTPASAIYRGCMNDFRQITGFTPWVFEKSDAAHSFLDREMCSSDVLVTHHLPSWQCVQPKYQGYPLNTFFVRDLTEQIIRVQPKLVVHGHTHESVDLQIGQSRVLCNPFGYDGHEVNEKYNPALVVDV